MNTNGRILGIVALAVLLPACKSGTPGLQHPAYRELAAIMSDSERSLNKKEYIEFLAKINSRFCEREDVRKKMGRGIKIFCMEELWFRQQWYTEGVTYQMQEAVPGRVVKDWLLADYDEGEWVWEEEIVGRCEYILQNAGKETKLNPTRFMVEPTIIILSWYMPEAGEWRYCLVFGLPAGSFSGKTDEYMQMLEGIAPMVSVR